MAQKITVTATDEDETALADVLRLIARQVEEGFTSGHDRRDTGDYAYQVEES